MNLRCLDLSASVEQEISKELGDRLQTPEWCNSFGKQLLRGQAPKELMCNRDSTLGSSEACSLLQHVGTRCWRDRGICRTAHRWRRSLLTRARFEPLQPVRPPTALVLPGAPQPL